MIDITKTTGDKTIYEFTGHAETTDVCSGFSALVCTFCACLTREKPDVKFIFERNGDSYIYEDGEETQYQGDSEKSVIEYPGSSRFEEFFDIGIESMSQEFPRSFVYKG